MVSRVSRVKLSSTFGPPTDDESLPSYKCRLWWRRIVADDDCERQLLGMPVACLGVLALELGTRIASYIVMGTEESFLKHHGYSQSQVSHLLTFANALGVVWALLAGWASDSALGRYRAVIASVVLLAAGVLVAGLAAWPAFSARRPYLLGAMVLIPFGAAGIRSNIAILGADQFDGGGASEVEGQEAFFSWLYFTVSMAAVVAYGGSVVFGSSSGSWIPPRYGYFVACIAAAGCTTLAAFAFTTSRLHDREQGPQRRSALAAAASGIARAALEGGSRQAATVCSGTVLLTCGMTVPMLASLGNGFSDTRWHWTAAAAPCVVLGAAMLTLPCLRPSWLVASSMSDAYISCSDVRAFLRLLPVLFSGNFAASMLYTAMRFWYQQQACQMDLRVPFSLAGSQFTGSFFAAANCVGVLMATPVALRYVNPRLESLWGTSFSHGVKFGIGMFFAAASVLTAARLEVHRRAFPVLDLLSSCAPEGVRMSGLSSASMLLPYALMGIGEVYTQPVLMHFAYTRSPPSMRTLAAVSSMLVGTASSVLCGAQVEALSHYMTRDLNDGRLEYGYYSSLLVAGCFYTFFIHALACFERRSFETSF